MPTESRELLEFRRQIVDFHRSRHSMKSRSEEFATTVWTISLWVTLAGRDGGKGDGGLTSAGGEELSRLRKQVRTLKEERDILSKAAAWFATEGSATSKRSSGS